MGVSGGVGLGKWALSYPISIILGYRPDVTPAVSNVFATAAMRFGHTMINPVLHRLDENFTSIPEGSRQSGKIKNEWSILYLDPL